MTTGQKDMSGTAIDKTLPKLTLSHVLKFSCTNNSITIHSSIPTILSCGHLV